MVQSEPTERAPWTDTLFANILGCTISHPFSLSPTASHQSTHSPWTISVSLFVSSTTDNPDCRNMTSLSLLRLPRCLNATKTFYGVSALITSSPSLLCRSAQASGAEKNSFEIQVGHSMAFWTSSLTIISAQVCLVDTSACSFDADADLDEALDCYNCEGARAAVDWIWSFFCDCGDDR